jgi:hypothetical protein
MRLQTAILAFARGKKHKVKDEQHFSENNLASAHTVWLRSAYFQLILLHVMLYVNGLHVSAVVSHGHDLGCTIKFKSLYDLLPEWLLSPYIVLLRYSSSHNLKSGGRRSFYCGEKSAWRNSCVTYHFFLGLG